MTVSAKVLAITSRLIPTPVMYKMLGYSAEMVRSTVRRNYLPIPSAVKPIVEEKPMVQQVHTCWDHMDSYEEEGISPSEYCEACQCDTTLDARMAALSEACKPSPDQQYTTEGYSTWEEISAHRAEEARLMDTDIMGLIDFDHKHHINRPWWYYMELEENKGKTRAELEEESRKSLEEYKIFKAKQAEFGYWWVSDEVLAARKKVEVEHEEYISRLNGSAEVVEAVVLPDNARDYVRSVDRRSGKEREAEFNSWLAIPKNKRPIFLEGGRLGPGVAKADIGSVVVKKCPPSVLLSDIRIIFSKFGGVRDVYRPKDRATGCSKPFVFVEMLKNAEAWSAVDYYAAHSLTLDENTFAVEGAGERKTTEQMAIIKPTTVVAPVEPQPIVQKSTKVVPKHKGAFSALMDSDSDSE
jgi:hypothetical protein